MQLQALYVTNDRQAECVLKIIIMIAGPKVILQIYFTLNYFPLRI
jgi:hypothetical protein